MATLQKIRSTGPLLVGVIALALFAFIAGDALKVFQPRQPQDVGEVDDTTLSIREYQQLVDEYSDIQKMMSGGSLSEMESNQVKDMVWNSFVSNQLISNEAEKLGLVVTVDELNSILDQGSSRMLGLASMFVNQQTGMFDKDQLFMFLDEYARLEQAGGNIDPNYAAQLHQVHAIWTFVEKSIIQERLAQKYTSLVSSGMISNKVEAESSFEGRTIQSDLLAALVPFRSIDESSVELSNADLENYYKENIERFKQENESRIIKYIDVKVNPSAQDVQDLQEEVTEYADLLEDNEADYESIINGTSGSMLPYNNGYFSLELYPEDVVARVKTLQVGEVSTVYTNSQDATINAVKVVDKKNLPDSIQFRMLQVYLPDAEAMESKTDSIITALRNGADFASISEEENQPAEAFWLSEKTITSNEQFIFYNELLDMKKNEIKKVPFQGGNIILQQLNSKNFGEKYKLAVIKREMEISSETATKAYNEFSQFVAENGTIESMVNNAEDAGYQVVEYELYSAMHNIANIGSTKEALRWAFDAKKDELSTIYECGADNDHLLVLGVTEIIPEGYTPMHRVMDQVRAGALNKKKAAYIENQFANANPSTIEEAAQVEYAVLDTIKHVNFASPAFVAKTGTSETVISGYAAGAKENALSKPITGNQSVMMLSVIKRQKSDEELDIEAEKAKVMNENRYYSGNTILLDLANKAIIKDYRYLYF